METRNALRATASVRAFAAKTVDDAVVYDILDDARFAPSGGNRQPWRVDSDLSRPTISGGGSIYPFCWSILLAARDETAAQPRRNVCQR